MPTPKPALKRPVDANADAPLLPTARSLVTPGERVSLELLGHLWSQLKIAERASQKDPKKIRALEVRIRHAADALCEKPSAKS